MEKIKKPPCNVNCSVTGCHSKKGRDTHLHFHEFPKANSGSVYKTNIYGVVEKVDRRTAWKDILRMKKNPSAHTKVCSKHFKPQDYILYSQNMRRPRLKLIAVPSLNLPQKNPRKSLHKKLVDRFNKRQELREIRQLTPNSKTHRSNSNERISNTEKRCKCNKVARTGSQCKSCKTYYHAKCVRDVKICCGKLLAGYALYPSSTIEEPANFEMEAYMNMKERLCELQVAKELMYEKILRLERENGRLRSEKTCRKCKEIELVNHKIPPKRLMLYKLPAESVCKLSLNKMSSELIKLGSENNAADEHKSVSCNDERTENDANFTLEKCNNKVVNDASNVKENDSNNSSDENKQTVLKTPKQVILKVAANSSISDAISKKLGTEENAGFVMVSPNQKNALLKRDLDTKKKFLILKKVKKPMSIVNTKEVDKLINCEDTKCENEITDLIQTPFELGFEENRINTPPFSFLSDLVSEDIKLD